MNIPRRSLSGLSRLAHTAYADCENLDVRVTCSNGASSDYQMGRCWEWSKFSCQLCSSKSYWQDTFKSQCGGSNVCVKITGGDFISDIISVFDFKCGS